MQTRNNTAASKVPSVAEARKLYARYGKPLEKDHQGHFVAVSPQGKTVIATSLPDALQKAADQFGPGNLVFKVGSRAVGSWR